MSSKPRNRKNYIGKSTWSVPGDGNNIPGDSKFKNDYRVASPIWKGPNHGYNFDEFPTSMKKKGLTKDDLTLKSHTRICNPITQTSNALASEVSR